MLVRTEQPADEPESRAAQVAAFGVAGVDEPVEARLLDALRRCDGWIPELSWVAEIDGRIVGHCITTRGHVGAVACGGLGPIGVLPEHQRDGAGSALIHASLGAADALGMPLVALLGDPAYYRRFGFVTSTEVGIDPPDPAWGVHFQVRTLSSWRPSTSGEFRYAAPFDELD